MTRNDLAIVLYVCSQHYSNLGVFIEWQLLKTFVMIHQRTCFWQFVLTQEPNLRSTEVEEVSPTNNETNVVVTFYLEKINPVTQCM